MQRGAEAEALARARARKPMDEVLVWEFVTVLGLDLAPGAADRFAEALLARLGSR